MAVAHPPARRRAAPGTRGWILACAVLAAVSLPLAHEPAYDPTAWLIWGKQLAGGTLDTVGGPSLKPLPVLLDVPFSLLGDAAAAWLWLFVARFAGLSMLVLAARLALRLGGGRLAAGLAATALGLASDVLYNCFRGGSEGLLVSATYGAVLAHLAGRPRGALALGALAGLVRPEVWPFLAIYGLWLIRHRLRVGTVLFVLATGVLVLGLWVLPERLLTDDGFRAASRAQNPVAGSPGQSAFPFGATFLVASIMLCWPVYAGAFARVRTAWRARRDGDGRERAVLVLAAGATAYMVLIGIEAELGFTGNLRYATLPASLVCVLGGLGLPGLLVRTRDRAAPWARAGLAIVAGIAVLVSVGVVGWGGYRLWRDEGIYGEQLPALIDRGGGRAGILACGPVAASPFLRQHVARRLDLPQRAVSTRVPSRGTLLTIPGARVARETRLPVLARTAALQLRSACPG